MQMAISGQSSRCEHHQFRLCPRSLQAYNGQYYNVSFCTCKTDHRTRRPKAHRITKHLTFPRFNPDRNFSTPAFILNSERNYYESQGVKMRAQHVRKMEDYTQEKMEINIPKPRSKNNYCSVCKGSYDDYLEHIQSDHHRRRIHQSAFNRDILQLGVRYQKEHRRRRVKGLQKNLSTRIEDSDSVEIISNPHKMVKQEERHLQAQVIHPRNNFPPVENQQIPQNAAFPVPGTFKPFSSTYQEMNQFIFNLNIFMNPFPVISPVPLFAPSPVELALQARQQELDMLKYSLAGQTQQMQLQMQMQMQRQMQRQNPMMIMMNLGQPPPPSGGSGRCATVIVIDE